MSLESTLSYVLIPYVRAGQLPFYTCPNIPEAPLRGRMDTRIWRNGMGCLYSTQLPKDSGCRRLLRLPRWHHHPGADGEGTQRTKAEIMYCTPLALIRGWLELGHVTIYNTKEVGMCSFSGCPGRGENMGVLVLQMDLSNSSTTIVQGPRDILKRNSGEIPWRFSNFQMCYSWLELANSCPSPISLPLKLEKSNISVSLHWGLDCSVSLLPKFDWHVGSVSISFWEKNNSPVIIKKKTVSV